MASDSEEEERYHQEDAPASSKNKRKERDLEDELGDTLKKFRITVSPSELRLKHDLGEPRWRKLALDHGVSIVPVSREPLTFQVRIRDRGAAAGGGDAGAAAAGAAAAGADGGSCGGTVAGGWGRWHRHRPRR